MALDGFRELGDKATQATCLTDLGATHLEPGRLTSAREYLRESLTIKHEIDDLDGLATTFRHLGQVESRAGNTVAARKFLTESLRVAEKIGDQKPAADIDATLTALEDTERESATAHLDPGTRGPGQLICAATEGLVASSPFGPEATRLAPQRYSLYFTPGLSPSSFPPAWSGAGWSA
jgi:tetratricopeptide repeat protein